MKNMVSAFALSIVALSISACSHAGPSDAQVNQAFANYGWARVGLSEAAKDKVHVQDCTANAQDSSIYVCHITVEGMAGSKASIPFKKNADGSWAVNL
jgi:hypothetical protein